MEQVEGADARDLQQDMNPGNTSLDSRGLRGHNT